MKAKPEAKVRWHNLLGDMLEALLSPVGIEVHTNYSIMTKSPEMDILLIDKGRHRKWTKEQAERLPDGIKGCESVYHIIEFKGSESINEDAFQQLLGYELFYRKSKQIKKTDTQCYLLSSKTPDRRTLRRAGFQKTSISGIYETKAYVLHRVKLIIANELDNTPNNAAIKCLASRKTEQKKALQVLDNQLEQHWDSERLANIVTGLYILFSERKGLRMQEALSTEQIIEAGKIFGKRILEKASVEERLQGLTTKEIIKEISTKEIIKEISTKEIIKEISTKELLQNLSTKEKTDLLKLLSEEARNSLKSTKKKRR